jgi:hypothetical protein
VLDPDAGRSSRNAELPASVGYEYVRSISEPASTGLRLLYFAINPRKLAPALLDGADWSRRRFWVGDSPPAPAYERPKASRLLAFENSTFSRTSSRKPSFR